VPGNASTFDPRKRKVGVDSWAAAVARSRDRVGDTVVVSGGGQDMSDERSVYPRFIVPTWPSEPFMLIAERGKFEYGPFEEGDFLVSEEDNDLYYSDGASHPAVCLSL
jgi:hypothetical protein